jgi:putative Holliday junction resolvase
VKFLGIDFGMRRIGVSASDPTGTLVRGVTTIDRKVTPRYIDELLKIIISENPEKLIFGLPLGHDDEESEMCKRVRKFSIKLLDKLETSLPHDFQDESYSSVRTQKLMQQNSTKKKRKNKGNVDRIAACIILEDYIRESSGNLLLY